MYEYTCKVERVVDGDTCDVMLDLGFNILHKCRVRLFCFDTPESRTRDLDEKARGKMASAFLETSIKAGDKIIIKTELDKKGKYGRILGVLWDENKKKNFNNMLVSEGHAVDYFGGKK